MEWLYFLAGSLLASSIWAAWAWGHRGSLKSAQAFLKQEFFGVAQDVFEQKSRILRDTHQAELGHLVGPLKEMIKQFEHKFQESHEKESRDRLSLFHEIQHLKNLNHQMAAETLALTQALKGNSKIRGNWGEMILERVLEMSGLQKGREYDMQVNLKNETGKSLQPDVIVHLPDNRDIIIDSKLSLIAYEKLFHSQSDDNTEYLQAHVQSMRLHLKQLGEKSYQKLLGMRSLDFILMFIPIESALHCALQYDENLIVEALSRNIILVTPTTLLSTLRTIHHIWRFQAQSDNAQLIAQKAGDMYDKFVALVNDLEDVGRKMESAQKSYAAVMNKLKEGKGNLMRRAEELRTMGAVTSKQLPVQLVDDKLE